jgi:Family of unknown function (DUF6527)
MSVPILLVPKIDIGLIEYVDGRGYRRDLAPGTAAWCEDYKALQFICPCGCGAHHCVNTTCQGTQSSWSWDGNIEKPTLKPSLGLYPKSMLGYHWHGYLTNGEFSEL